MYSQIEREKINLAYILAKAVRIVTVPPIMALMLLLLVRNFSSLFVFKSSIDFIMSMILLVIVPFSAYPVSYMITKIRQKGREGQRNLAFITCTLGYVGAMTYGIIADATDYLMLIFLTYFLSVIALSVFNKALKIRASGHSCSMCGPLLLSIYFIGADFIAVSLLIFALIIWASLETKQHTVKELSLGAMCAAVSFIISTFFINLGLFLASSGIIY